MNQNQMPQSKWEEMHPDLLLRIFSTFSLMQLVLNVSSVCKSWRSLCSHPCLWKSLYLDLTELDNHFHIPQVQPAWSDFESSQRFWRILKHLVDLSNENLSTMIFHLFIDISDKHLSYTARRCPNLKKLVLPGWSNISENGYEKCFKFCRGIESLVIPYCNIAPDTMIKHIGKNLKNLLNLKILFQHFDKKCAIAILRYLPKLKTLSLKGSVIKRNAVEFLLDKMENLEELNLTHCYMDVMGDYPQYLQVRHPIYKPIIRKASRLKKFYVCRTYNCVMCCRQYNPPQTAVLRWQELWRTDEIKSLEY